MLYQKQCEVYNYFNRRYFILLMPDLGAEKSNEIQGIREGEFDRT